MFRKSHGSLDIQKFVIAEIPIKVRCQQKRI